MTFYVTNQNNVVFSLALVGVLFGVLWDLFEIKRTFLRTGKILIFFEDLLYFALFTVVFVMTVFVTNYGYIRWYEFVGVFSGFAFYKAFFSKTVVAVISFFIRLLGRIIAAVLNPFFWLFRRVGKIICFWYFAVCKILNEKRLKVNHLKMKKKYLGLSEKGFFKENTYE